MRSSLSRKEVLTDSSSSSSSDSASSSSSSESDGDFGDKAEAVIDAVVSDSSSSSSSSDSSSDDDHKCKKKKPAVYAMHCTHHGRVHVCRYVREQQKSGRALPSDPARISVKHVKKALPLAAAAIDSAAAAMQELTVADDHDDAAAAIGTAEQQARLEAIRARPLGSGDALTAASAAKQPVPGLKPIGRRQQRSARTGRYTKAAAPMPGLRALKPAGDKGTYLALSDDDAPSVSSGSDSSSSSSSDSDDGHVRHHKLAEEDEYNRLYNDLAAQLGGTRYVNALITEYHEKYPAHRGSLRHGKYAFAPLDDILANIEEHGIEHVRSEAEKAYYSRRAARIVDDEEARYDKHLPTPNSTHLSARVGAKAAASPTSAMPGLVPISSAPRNAAAGKKSVVAAAKPTIRVKGAAAAPASRRRAAPAKAAISDAY